MGERHQVIGCEYGCRARGGKNITGRAVGAFLIEIAMAHELRRFEQRIQALSQDLQSAGPVNATGKFNRRIQKRYT